MDEYRIYKGSLLPDDSGLKSTHKLLMFSDLTEFAILDPEIYISIDDGFHQSTSSH